MSIERQEDSKGINKNFTRKDTYIITGAGSGIGKAISERLNSDGIHVVNVDIAFNEIMLESCTIDNYKLDLGNYERIRELFKYCQKRNYRLKGLVHCASICPLQDIENISGTDVEKVYTINVFSFIELSRCFFEYENRCEDSRILAISSITADRAFRRQLLYSSSKAATNQLALSLAQEGINKDVKVNVLQLGAVETKMFKSLDPNMQTITRHYPLGILSAEEVAEIICDLLSKKYKKMSGSIIKIDSGYGISH